MADHQITIRIGDYVRVRPGASGRAGDLLRIIDVALMADAVVVAPARRAAAAAQSGLGLRVDVADIVSWERRDG